MVRMCVMKGLLFLLLMHQVCGKVTISSREETPFFDFSTAEHISSFGYPVEVHRDVETEDGYLLTIHRIPHGINNSTNQGTRPVVFLNHGMGSSADCWVLFGPEKGLGFLLADLGYDVWMGNARGTSHSRKHVSLDPDKNPDFWDFSWHEIGYYDLPTNLKYILNETNQSKLTYIGHSQGGTTFYVMTTTRPEMNDHIKLAVGLAPGVCYGSPNSTVNPHLASRIFETLESLRKLAGVTEIGPQFKKFVCKMPVFTEEICNAAMLALGLSLSDPLQLSFELLEIVKKYAPNSISMRQVLHYAQLKLSAEFQQYNFGEYKNLHKYNQEVPPFYDLKLATAPAALFGGPQDTLVTPPNVARLGTILPNVVLEYLVPFPAFNHFDFVIARDVVDLVYNKIFEIMEEYVDK